MSDQLFPMQPVSQLGCGRRRQLCTRIRFVSICLCGGDFSRRTKKIGTKVCRRRNYTLERYRTRLSYSISWQPPPERHLHFASELASGPSVGSVWKGAATAAAEAATLAPSFLSSRLGPVRVRPSDLTGAVDMASSVRRDANQYFDRRPR